MAAPLSNRFIHLEMETSVEDWKVWAVAKGVDSSIIAFISYRPDALFAFDTQSNSRSFATPRTWEYVNEVIASEPEADLLMPLVSGAIGEELAAAFLGFRVVAADLPDIDTVLDGSCTAVPHEPSALHMLSTALSLRVDQGTSSKKLNNLVGYTLKMPGEFAVMIVQDLRARNIELDHVDNWTLWMKNFNQLLR
jgi:hypothetical protein